MDKLIVWKLLLFVAVVAGSFGLGYAIAAALRMRDLSLKIGTVLFTLGLAFSPFLNTVLIEKKPVLDTLSFGIDLAGGTNLVYELERSPKDEQTVENMVNAIKRRIDPTGTQELAIRQVGKNQIEIIIPKATPEEVENIKAQVTSVGMLEFAILATSHNEAHQKLITRAATVQGDLRENGRVIAGWRPVAPITRLNSDGTTTETPNRELGNDPSSGISVRQIRNKPEGFNEVLCVFDRDEKKRVTGRYLAHADPAHDDHGKPCVHFTLTAPGGTRFRALTTTYGPRTDGTEYKLAVLLDDVVQTAPNIHEPIGAQGQITGNYTDKEVRRIVGILNAGALDVPLKKTPVSEFSISPLLGVDVQRKGFTAMFLASVGVFAALLAYYLWLGVLADICLLLNLILLMGSMAFIDSTLTLPGLAGIVLTMGMAVDANILIYERMREEIARGSTMRMAIQNGFDKAFSAIFDGNITAMLTAAILYVIGTDQVKGFAVTLFIGLAISMYTALTVNHLMLNIIERKRWLKKFRTLSLFGVTNIDFVSKQWICGIASVVLITAGLVTFFVRGEENYDIDFSGGTMITMKFNEKQNADDVRNKLNETLKTDVSLEQLTSSDPKQDGTTFRMRTTNQDQDAVEKGINAAFGDALVKTRVTPGELKPIAEAKAPTPPKEGEEDAKLAEEEKPADPFAGGHQVELTFSSPTRPDTAARYARQELVKLKKAGEPNVPKYGEDEQVRALIGYQELPTDQKPPTAEKITLKIHKDVSAEDAKTILASMKKTLDESPSFEEVNNFASSVAGDTKSSAVLAMLASLVMIVGYMWFRFENLYFGLAAVLALIHDVLATLGLVCMAAVISNTPIAPILLLADFKINLTMVAAFLTIVGYSLNDTIVIFDRLREIRGKNPLVTRDMVNQAVNETLSRTLLTAGMVFITVVILYALGGEGIHGFAYAMVIGTIVGCYSTIYIASPAVVWLMDRQQGLANRLSVRKPDAVKVGSESKA